MKLILVQKDVNNLDYKKFLDEAVNQSPDIVCFPELATSGCLYHGGSGVDFDDLISTLSGYGFSSLLGFPRKHEGQLYNSYMYFRDGKYRIYDKINLFEPMNEPKVYTPGNAPGLIETQFGIIGLAICYDLRFPALFTQLAGGGAKLIFVPAAFPRVRIADWKELIVRRAIETGLPVIGVNAVGDDGVNEFGGCSTVADPGGHILVQADETGERVLQVDI